jgi:hypothetical protein
VEVTDVSCVRHGKLNCVRVRRCLAADTCALPQSKVRESMRFVARSLARILHLVHDDVDALARARCQRAAVQR